VKDPRLESLTRRHANARRRERLRVGGLVTTLSIALFLHVAVLGAMSPFWSGMTEVDEGHVVQPVRLVVVQPTQVPEAEPEPEVPDHGQIVDLPPPIAEEVPEDADYLAIQARVVEQETQTRFRVNPEVLSPVFSLEDRIELEDVVELDLDADSTGATPGQETFDLGKDGTMASLPSKYRFTNKEGVQAPVAASHTSQRIAGAPNNDLLKVERGEATLLSTKEFAYAAYINIIRRLVNFYWHQALDNVPGTIRLAKPRYTTVVDVELAADGSLYAIEVIEDCGSPPLDNAVVEAFKIAGPFPAPPDGLVDPDGVARLPKFGFTVNIGQARASYQGIDPRAGVQFPGILKAPR
jgi:TonB family protein